MAKKQVESGKQKNQEGGADERKEEGWRKNKLVRSAVEKTKT